MQQSNISNELDKNITRSANFIFKIDNIALIRFVNLATQLGPIIFYIMLINISFLLFLANMNKLGAFFYNIINRIKQLQIWPA